MPLEAARAELFVASPRVVRRVVCVPAPARVVRFAVAALVVARFAVARFAVPRVAAPRFAVPRSAVARLAVPVVRLAPAVALRPRPGLAGFFAPARAGD